MSQGCSELRKQKSTVIIVPFLTCKCPTAVSVNNSPFYACQNLRGHNNFTQVVLHGLLFAQWKRRKVALDRDTGTWAHLGVLFVPKEVSVCILASCITSWVQLGSSGSAKRAQDVPPFSINPFHSIFGSWGRSVLSIATSPFQGWLNNPCSNSLPSCCTLCPFLLTPAHTTKATPKHKWPPSSSPVPYQPLGLTSLQMFLYLVPEHWGLLRWNLD